MLNSSLLFNRGRLTTVIRDHQVVVLNNSGIQTVWYICETVRQTHSLMKTVMILTCPDIVCHIIGDK